MAAMTTHRGNSRPGDAVRPRAARPASQPDTGSLTIGGLTRNVARARAFVAEVLGPDHPCADVAILLCSELVTNAILHSDSGLAGGSITVVVAKTTASVQVKVIDDGSASNIPVVKTDVYAPDGRGLFLVENLAEQWGYECDEDATTVWCRVVP